MKQMGKTLIIAVLSGLLAWSASGHAAPRYDTEPPELPADLKSPAVLVFSKTNGFRHVEAIPAANAALAEMGQRQGWVMFFTENAAVHTPEQLERFATVVWNNVSGDVLNEAQREAFRSYVENGGGFVGLHGSGGDTVYKWPWYVQQLIRAQFIGHPMNPQFQSATLRVEDRQDYVTQDLPGRMERIDEWYSFAQSPRGSGVKVLVSIDETSYVPVMRINALTRDLRMGKDHPVVWRHCVGRGRAFYSAFGHRAESYAERLHVKLIERAITWTAGLAGEACEDEVSASTKE